jgi:tetratricopeptide (TPR) repeat protein
MSGSNPSLWLLVVAVLGTPSPVIFAQSPTEVSIAIPQTQLSAPHPQPTPEQLADALMFHQRYQAAIEAYQKAPSDSPSVWNKMGIAYQLMFDLDDAARCYQASLKIDPRNANVLNNLGTVFDSLKEYGSAERMYRKALQIDPNSALIEKNLGTSLLAQHKYKKGWEVYKAALALDPNIFKHNSSVTVDHPGSIQERGAMNYYLAKGCVRAGMNGEAIDYLRMAVNEGFTNSKKIAADSEFATLRGIPAFEQLLGSESNP